MKVYSTPPSAGHLLVSFYWFYFILILITLPLTVEGDWFVALRLLMDVGAQVSVVSDGLCLTHLPRALGLKSLWVPFYGCASDTKPAAARIYSLMMSLLPELKEPPYHRCMLSCLLNPTQTLVYKMPTSPLDSGFQSIQWMNICFREPKMIIKTFANTQYPQIEPLSHKNQLITQPVAMGLSIFSARLC